MTAAGSLERVRELMLADVDYAESPPYSNKTKYGEWYGLNGVAWCVEAQQYWFFHAGCPIPVRTAYSPTVAEYYQDHGLWSKTPRSGAFGFYNFGGGRISHIDWVDVVQADGSTITIGGNTSAGAGGSQNNGGQVARKVRRPGRDPIVGYGLPVYKVSDMPAPKLDLTHPAIYYPAHQPNGSGPSSESQWLPVLLKYATKANAGGDHYSQFQLIPWDRRDVGPDPKLTPRESIVIGIDFRWAPTNQVFGGDGGHTVRLALNFLGIGL